MRHLIPSVREISIFAALSVGLAVLVTAFASASSRDLGLSFSALPLFIVAAVMGLRRNWSRVEADVEITETPATVDATGA
jgi:riboflavin transporter FmnP